MRSGLIACSLSPYKNSSTSSATARILTGAAVCAYALNVRPARARRRRGCASGEHLVSVGQSLNLGRPRPLKALGETFSQDPGDVGRRVKPGNVDEISARLVKLESMRDVLGG